MTTTTVAGPGAAPRTTKRPQEEVARQRSVDLLLREIRFVPNDTFSYVEEDTEEGMLTDIEAGQVEELSFTSTPGFPAHLARLCDSELLPATTERELFFRKNFLQFRANVLRSRLNPNRPDIQSVQRIERLLKAARMVRDRILRANTRLVMSVVKKFATPQHSFDELLSTGIGALMRAIDSFDYDRGFRFSTYAYRTISRQASRTIADHNRRANRFVTGAEESIFEAPIGDSHSKATEQAQSQLHSKLHELIDRLDRRDRFVIRCRYALGGHRKAKTCQYLADKLGLSKERVRQLEHRAVAKLRALAAECQLHDLAEAVIGCPRLTK